jgi:hypothetical protein
LGKLLEERIKSREVLKMLIDYAHGRFSNPTTYRIRRLFKTCGMTNVLSSLKKRYGREIDHFVEIRNNIAHGGHMPNESRDVEEWVRLIRGFADYINSVVEYEVNVMK